jgi:hypothetical protein
MTQDERWSNLSFVLHLLLVFFGNEISTLYRSLEFKPLEGNVFLFLSFHRECQKKPRRAV